MVETPFKLEVKPSGPNRDALKHSNEGTLPRGAKLDPSLYVFSWTRVPSAAGKFVTVVFVMTDGHFTVKETAAILVKAKGTGCIEYGFKPNNEPGQAKKMTQGKFPSLLICDTGVSTTDEDWLKYLLTGGDNVAATVPLTHSLGDKEPKEKISEAFAIEEPSTSGTPIEKLSICPYNLNLFTVEVECGKSLIATIKFKQSKGDPALYFFSTFGEAALDQSVREKGIGGVVSEAGSAQTQEYIVVTGYPHESTSNWSVLEVLKDNAGNCSRAVNELNDRDFLGTRLTAAGKSVGLMVCCDKDYFSFPLGPGKVAVKLIPSGAGTVTGCFVSSLSPSFSVGADDTSGLCIGSQPVPESGLPYLGVEGAYGTIYTLEVTIERGSVADAWKGHCDDFTGICDCDSQCVEFQGCCADVCLKRGDCH